MKTVVWLILIIFAESRTSFKFFNVVNVYTISVLSWVLSIFSGSDMHKRTNSSQECNKNVLEKYFLCRTLFAFQGRRNFDVEQKRTLNTETHFSRRMTPTVTVYTHRRIRSRSLILFALPYPFCEENGHKTNWCVNSNFFSQNLRKMHNAVCDWIFVVIRLRL